MSQDVATPQDKQIEIAERLKLALLEYLEEKLADRSISSTDVATLTRLLSQNGWALDPTRVPSRLRDKLTSTYDPEQVDLMTR
jgi:hypothetical protein